MDKLKQAIRRAEHVRELLNDSVLTDAWASVEQELRNAWAETKSHDAEGREALYREIHALKAVRTRLERIIKTGTLAERELEHQKHGNRDPQTTRS